MNFRKKAEDQPGIIIIPMIDVMFFLLIFFMMATMNLGKISSVPVKLPALQTAKNVEGTGLTITIKQDGKLFVDDKELTKDKVNKAIANVAKDNKNMMVILRVDRNVPYHQVAETMDALKAKGIRRIALAGEKRTQNEDGK